jgi:hypothetical protein
VVAHVDDLAGRQAEGRDVGGLDRRVGIEQGEPLRDVAEGWIVPRRLFRLQEPVVLAELVQVVVDVRGDGLFLLGDPL